MKYDQAGVLIALAGLGLAKPLPAQSGSLRVREVPQEHSHNHFLDLVRTSLNLNNPAKIQDPVFGLLGNAAAAAGAGSITNLDCLQQATADQAFTNALKVSDVAGMAGALVYRALERNTGSVGLASVICNETAVNPQIAAISQHQDPASANAASTNAAIALALAKELAGIGADPLLALESGTFAPGKLGDPTAKGNSCDTENDEPGCIFSQKLLVLDVSEAQISSAVAGITPTITATGVISATDIDLSGLSVADATAAAAAVSTAAAAAADASETEASECPAETTTAAAAPAAAASSCSVVTTTVAAESASAVLAAAAGTQAAATAVATSASSASGSNVQKFTGTLGGPPPPVVSSSGERPFTVNGNTFVNIGAAIQRSCDIQNNACSNAVNSGQLSGKSVSDCNTQQSQCEAANGSQKRAGNFGSCGDPTILFEAGLDGRNTEAFIAADQSAFNHGSALNIAVIAGFICQRLGSPCDAPADVQASCTSASAAAVATTQNQAAADAFNSIIGASGSGGAAAPAAAAAVTTAAAAAAAVTTAAAAAAATAASSVVLTMTMCS